MNRRTFLKGAAITGVAAFITPQCLDFGIPKRNPARTEIWAPAPPELAYADGSSLYLPVEDWSHAPRARIAQEARVVFRATPISDDLGLPAVTDWPLTGPWESPEGFIGEYRVVRERTGQYAIELRPGPGHPPDQRVGITPASAYRREARLSS